MIPRTFHLLAASPRRAPNPVRSGLACAALLLVGWGVSAGAEDSTVIITNFYPVTGSTAREIRQSINQARPGGTNATTDALTTWDIKWKSRVTSANGQCRLDQIDFKTTVTYTLPSWRAPTNAPPELIKRWVTYYQALQEHEDNHARTGNLAVETARNQVATIGPEADCAMLQKKLKATIDAVIAEHRQRDADYDRETNHGRKQGAKFP